MSLDVMLIVDMDPTEVFEWNITHNLGAMAREAGIYEALWHPEECGINYAHQLMVPLAAGRLALIAEPEYFRKFAPENGWGTYEGCWSLSKNIWKHVLKIPTLKFGLIVK